MAKKIKIGDYVEVVTKMRDKFECIVVKYYPEKRAFYGRIIRNWSGPYIKTTKWDRYSVPETDGQFVLLDDCYSLTVISPCSYCTVTRFPVSRTISYDHRETTEGYGSGGQFTEHVPEERIHYAYVKLNDYSTAVFCTVHDTAGGEYGGWGKYTSAHTQKYAENTAYEQAMTAMRNATTPRGFKL